MDKILEIKNLSVFTKKENHYALKDISFDINKGGSIGIIGESGSGKSILSKAIFNILPENFIKSGDIFYKNQNIDDLFNNKNINIYGSELSIIFQNCQNSLNPLRNVEYHLFEVCKRFRPQENPKEISIDYLLSVGIKNPDKILKLYPHELSGGLAQRILIGMSLIAQPKLLFLDEPTTALDATIEKEIIKLLIKIKNDMNNTQVFISHDIDIVEEISEKLIVLYGGKIMEIGYTKDIISNPYSPYTESLISSIPKPKYKGKYLRTIKGNPPSISDPKIGCPFYDRCKYSNEICKLSFPKAYKVNENHTVYCHLRSNYE